MSLVYGIVTLVLALGYMLYVKKTANPSESGLFGNQRYVVPILCIFNPAFSGLIFYYGWKNDFPQKAQTANHWSLGAFLVALAVYAGLQWAGSDLSSKSSTHPVEAQGVLRGVAQEGGDYLEENNSFSGFCSEVPELGPFVGGRDMTADILATATCAASSQSYAVSLPASDGAYCISGQKRATSSAEVRKGYVADRTSARCVSSLPVNESAPEKGGNSDNYFQ